MHDHCLIHQQTDSLPESDNSKPDPLLSADLEAQVKQVKSLLVTYFFNMFKTDNVEHNICYARVSIAVWNPRNANIKFIIY